MTNIKFQNYKHYKLPITINPLEYGKLIIKMDNIIVSQINRTNIAVISQFNELNIVKIFKEGDFLFKYSDHKIDENNFIRSLENKKFTFENNELFRITTEKLINAIIKSNKLISAIIILLILFSIFNENYSYYI
jgi:hypothetical protein